MSERCVVLLGSNIEPERNLPAAVAALARRCHVLDASSAWRSPAVGAAGTPDFLNAAVVIETELAPHELRERVLREVEAELGRVRSQDKNAPRTIDLDLVLYGELVLDDRARRLVLPDPALLAHAYAAVPVREIASSWRWPGGRATFGELTAQHASARELVRADIDLRAHIGPG